jgi:hypothetical protein
MEHCPKQGVHSGSFVVLGRTSQGAEFEPSHFVAKNLSHIKMPCAVCWQQSLQEHLLSFLDRESRKVSTMANLMIGSEYDAAGDPYIYVVWVW